MNYTTVYAAYEGSYTKTLEQVLARYLLKKSYQLILNRTAVYRIILLIGTIVFN